MAGVPPDICPASFPPDVRPASFPPDVRPASFPPDLRPASFQPGLLPKRHCRGRRIQPGFIRIRLNTMPTSAAKTRLWHLVGEQPGSDLAQYPMCPSPETYFKLFPDSRLNVDHFPAQLTAEDLVCHDRQLESLETYTVSHVTLLRGT